jgi:putative hydrolase
MRPWEHRTSHPHARLSQGKARMVNFPFGFTPDDNNKFDLAALGAMLQQLGGMLQKAESLDEGPIAWSMIRDTALTGIKKTDTQLTIEQQNSVNDAIRLAQDWLDAHTTLPASSATAMAWNERSWLENSFESWKPIISPVALAMSGLMTQMNPMQELGDVPPELQQMLMPMLQMAEKLGAISTATQIGQGLASLATETLSGGDISIPLEPNKVPALLPEHIAAFAKNYELPASEVLMLCAVREAAICRLYSQYPWIEDAVIGAIVKYSRGITFNEDHLREMMSGINPEDPESLQAAMSEGLFEPPTTDEQVKALTELEFLLALIDGWVSFITHKVISGKLTNADALLETMNRRRVTGSPAAKVFSQLVGLQLRPSLIRSASDFFAEYSSHATHNEMNFVFTSPDTLPTAADFQDVAGYLRKIQIRMQQSEDPTFNL